MGGTFMLVVFTVAFVGIAIWAYLPRNKARMNDYAEIPLREDTHVG